MAKSLFMAYLCWLFGGIFGLHHFYLGRDRQGVIYFVSIGGFLVGFIYDLFKIPDYLNEANNDSEYIDELREAQLNEPRFSVKRFLCCLIFGAFFNYVASHCIHFNDEQTNYYVLLQLIVPLIEAFIVHFVGTDGPLRCNQFIFF